MAPRLTAVLFDLDGTLIDSLPLIVASFRHALDEHGLEASDAAIHQGLGTPLHGHLAQLAPEGHDVDELVATYRRFNHAEHDGRVRAFDGISAALDGLAEVGLVLGVVTSKRLPLARRGLAICGLHHDFRVLVGPEDVERPKPHPDPLLLAAERLQLEPTGIAYVGDSHHDLDAAHAAGMVPIGAAWGALDLERLVAARPHRMLERPGELVELAGAR